jgi:hypothetical protein
VASDGQETLPLQPGSEMSIANAVKTRILFFMLVIAKLLSFRLG